MRVGFGQWRLDRAWHSRGGLGTTGGSTTTHYGGTAASQLTNPAATSSSNKPLSSFQPCANRGRMLGAGGFGNELRRMIATGCLVGQRLRMRRWRRSMRGRRPSHCSFHASKTVREGRTGRKVLKGRHIDFVICFQHWPKLKEDFGDNDGHIFVMI